MLTAAIHISLSTRQGGISSQDKLAEAVSLCAAIDLDVAYHEAIALKRYDSGTLLTKGHAERLKEIIAEREIGLVLINHPLSPTQQRNLEKLWNAKVIDRTALILEIFGARANTKEGKLQVELAALTYQRSRLVRSWTHLERQRGGMGFVGGPGETQLELDRRMIDERIKRIKTELDKVKKTRENNRKSRKSVPYPVIAFVGYTNAGKSTLFNRITKANVFAKDLLFATLDPTMRAVTLHDHKKQNPVKVIFSDTVGFISDLPTQLIASFRATLEEVLQAQIIVHVVDVSSPHAEEQMNDVLDILEELGVETANNPQLVTVFNKIDRVSQEDRQRLITLYQTDDSVPILCSALNGEGISDLIDLVYEKTKLDKT